MWLTWAISQQTGDGKAQPSFFTKLYVKGQNFVEHLTEYTDRLNTNIYSYLFLCDFICFIIVVSFYWAFGPDAGTGDNIKVRVCRKRSQHNKSRRRLARKRTRRWCGVVWRSHDVWWFCLRRTILRRTAFPRRFSSFSLSSLCWWSWNGRCICAKTWRASWSSSYCWCWRCTASFSSTSRKKLAGTLSFQG